MKKSRKGFLLFPREGKKCGGERGKEKREKSKAVETLHNTHNKNTHTTHKDEELEKEVKKGKDCCWESLVPHNPCIPSVLPTPSLSFLTKKNKKG